VDISEEINKIIVIFYKYELYDLYKVTDCCQIVKRRRVRWAGHVGRTGETNNIYRMLLEKIYDGPR